MVYSHNIDYNIVRAEDCLQTWESWGLELTADQKLYRLIFKFSVLPALLLRSKKQKKDADQSAINTLARMTRRINGEGKKKEKKKEKKGKIALLLKRQFSFD